MKTLPRIILQGLKEKDYDDLILRNGKVLASLLCEAELIEADSELKPLGQQIAGIGVLFAEARGDYFVRLS